MTFDVIIVGGGAAGLTAALYSARRGLSVAVISQDIGGQASTTSIVENYPGFDLIDGLELMLKFKTQAEKYGAKILVDEVTNIAKPADDFIVTTATAEYSAPALILAHGLTHKHLNVPGESELIGKGVSFCATCDAPLFKGKEVAVVGGGNSAMDAALVLAQWSPNVTLITHHPEFRGEKVLIERVMATSHIRRIVNGVTKEIHGETVVDGISVEHSGAIEKISVQGVFVEIGFTVNPALMKDLVALDARNQVIVDPLTNGTNISGLFAAGDVTVIPQKQIVISAGEGAKAALSVHQYLQALGKTARTGTVDWGVGTPLHHAIPPTQ